MCMFTTNIRLNCCPQMVQQLNATVRVLLARDSDRTGRDDVEISRGGSQPACSRRFIRVKPRETNVQRMLYSML